MKHSLSLQRMLALNAYWAGLSFMWSALHPIVIPALLLGVVPERYKNTYLGLLTFGGLLLAMLVQPLAGAISDRWRSPFGRRRPMIVIGTAGACLFLIILGIQHGLFWLVLVYAGLQLSSNTAQAPLQGLLRDQVPEHQLSSASSIKIVIDLLSLVAAAGLAGPLMAGSAGALQTVTGVIFIVLLVSAAITVRFTPEASTADANRTTRIAAPHDEPHLGWRSGYAALLAERALFLLGIYGLQAFGEYFLADVIHAAEPARAAGNLLAAVGTGTLLFVIAGGRLTASLGARAVLFGCSAVAVLGLLMMAVAASIPAVVAAGLCVGCAIGLFLTANWTLANQLAPRAQAGVYLGLTNLATAGSAAIARLQGPAVDWLNGMAPSAWLGYRGIFVLGALCIAASLVFLARIRTPDGRLAERARAGQDRNL